MSCGRMKQNMGDAVPFRSVLGRYIVSENTAMIFHKKCCQKLLIFEGLPHRQKKTPPKTRAMIRYSSGAAKGSKALSPFQTYSVFRARVSLASEPYRSRRKPRAMSMPALTPEAV